MKFLHLADLHLGKRVNGFDMLEDQRFILEQILTLCEKHGVGIMFDDCEHVIRSFNADMNSRPVLVSTCHVAHNKTFAKTYDTVLTEWDELHSIYEKLTVRKDNV